MAKRAAAAFALAFIAGTMIAGIAIAAVSGQFTEDATIGDSVTTQVLVALQRSFADGGALLDTLGTRVLVPIRKSVTDLASVDDSLAALVIAALRERFDDASAFDDSLSVRVVSAIRPSLGDGAKIQDALRVALRAAIRPSRAESIGVVDSLQLVKIVARPVVSAPADQNALEGAATSFTLGSFSAPTDDGPWSVEVDWGDGSAHTTFTASASGSLGSRSHVYAEGPSLWMARVTVTGRSGASGSATFAVRVSNVAPTIGAISAPTAPIAVGTAFTVSAPFSDPGTLDSFVATMSWGDGTTTTQPLVAGSTMVTMTHSYAAAGVFTLSLVVADDDGGEATATFQYVVAYDGTAGFVTGGGWITSPTGAYALGPSLTGRATFGFVSRYARGAATPDGNTEFRFDAGNLHFRSTSYDWLVVAGARAQFKGSGTINDEGDYAFLLTAVDGQVSGGGGTDRFRIKIWVRASGQIVYDNQAGSSDSALPSTTIGGGSIVIHN